MSYFESSKNKAIWTKRLNALRKEKAERAKYGFKPMERVQTERETEITPGRRPISFEELVAKCEAKLASRSAAEASVSPAREAAREAAKARRHQKEKAARAL